MTPKILVLLLTISLLTCACSSLEFRNVRILDQHIDAETQSYRLQLGFELLDGSGLPVQAYDAPVFHVVEDGVPATSESIRLVEQESVFRPVILLLDTSLSMSGGIGVLRDAATEFVAKLHEQGFEDVSVHRFARTVHEVEDLAGLEASFHASPDERWTALYYALEVMLAQSPDAILVVFSDGADNYSQNFDVAGLAELTDSIEQTGAEVHAIGCGAVSEERDRDGILGSRALKRIAQNGTYQYVESVDGLDEVFAFIAARLQNLYSLEYFSPNLAGDHELVIEARVGRARGESEPILFHVGD